MTLAAKASLLIIHVRRSVGMGDVSPHGTGWGYCTLYPPHEINPADSENHVKKILSQLLRKLNRTEKLKDYKNSRFKMQYTTISSKSRTELRINVAWQFCTLSWSNENIDILHICQLMVVLRLHCVTEYPPPLSKKDRRPCINRVLHVTYRKKRENSLKVVSSVEYLLLNQSLLSKTDRSAIPQ